MGDSGSIILMVVLLVAVVALFAISYFRKKRFNDDLTSMRNDLKIGDKVMTDTGVVGELVDTYEEEGYKYFVLKSGKGSNVGYFAVHANAIYYVFGKENANTNSKVKSIVNQPIAPEQAETKAEESKAEVKSAQNEEVKTEKQTANKKRK